jgi:hypothetical protein
MWSVRSVVKDAIITQKKLFDVHKIKYLFEIHNVVDGLQVNVRILWSLCREIGGEIKKDL